MFDRAKLFVLSLFASFFGIQGASDGLQLSLQPLRTNARGGAGGGVLAGGGKKTLGQVILFVLVLFIVFLFATSGIIANSNIQTQLKNGAYYGGLFASVVVILIVLTFIL